MKITMAHGSGGKSSAELMGDIFGKHFKNQVLDKMEDAAVLKLPAGADGNTRIATSTDSFVVTPLVFKGGDIGKLCVCGTVNDLLMMGAEPKYLTCGFILEEGLEVDLLDKIVESMAAQAREAGVIIVAGDTKVVEGNGGLYINTTGIGLIPEGRDVSSANCREGDVIICSGNLGDHHACILSHRMEIENNIHSDCAALNDIVDALFAAGVNVKTMRDVTRGGLGTVINEIAESSKCQIVLEEDAIPVNPEVKGFADILGLDPLYMGNEGKMIAVVPADQAEAALAAMKATKHGADAAVIGQIHSCSEGLGQVEGPAAFIRTRLGATRRFDVLYGEGLPRIC
ncbi:MAG: hydrogenase expression/formation protein HypE [Firmicutes bacterium]|nr:hydrogenase expression/formation protein HypE [Bacillota bacterium]